MGMKQFFTTSTA